MIHTFSSSKDFLPRITLPIETAVPIDGSQLHPSPITITINLKSYLLFLLFLVIIVLLFVLAVLIVGFITRPRAQSEIFVKPESSLTFSNMTIASHLNISVKNPSNHPFLCRASMQYSFSQGPRRETTVSAALHCTTPSEDHLEVDFARGEVDTQVILLTSVEFRPWWIFYQPSFLCSHVLFTHSSKGGKSMMYAMASERC